MHEADFFAIFLSPLNTVGIPYMVTGSMACIIYGQPRMTHDIDLVVAVDTKKAELFSSLFTADEFYCPPSEVIKIELLRDIRGHFNIIHHSTGMKADIYPAGRDKLMTWGLKNRKKYTVRGETVWAAPPEYVIVQKLHYYREGGSPKHLADIRGVLDTSGDCLDMRELNNLIEEYKLREIWTLTVNRKV